MGVGSGPRCATCLAAGGAASAQTTKDPGTLNRIEQVRRGGGVITRAMSAGQVGIGFMGLGPFIVGWSRGVPWKLAVATAAERELGNPRASDRNLVPMAHADGERAPLFPERERQQPGIHRVLDSYEVFDWPHTFHVAVVTKDFYEKRREVYDAFVAAMAEAVTIV